MSGPPRLRRNALSNFAGLLILSLLPLLASILYVPLLGGAQFGLVSAASFLLTLGSSLDLGLSRATTQRFAQAAATRATGREPRDFLATAHLLYLGVLLPFCLAVTLGAGFLTRHWLIVPDALQADAEQALWLLGPVIFIHCLRVMDLAALNGVERQGLSNLLQTGALVVRLLVSLLVLRLIDQSIVTLLLAWLLVALVEMLVIGLVVRSSLIRLGFTQGGVPRRALVSSLLTGARSDGVFSLMTLLTGFADKLVLSRLLPIDLFGLYHLISLLAAALNRLIAPIAFAVFPRWVAQQAAGDRDGFSSSYHAAAQIAGALILPTMLAGLLFAPRVLAALFPSAPMPDDLVLAFQLLTVAGAAAALNYLPYSAQLAVGATQIVLRQALISGAIYLPLVLLATPHLGLFLPVGARLALEGASYLVFAWVMNRRVLPGEGGRLLRQAVFAPLVGAALPFLLGGLALAGTPLSLGNFGVAVLTGFGGIVGALLATPAGRRAILRSMGWRRG